MKQIILDYRTTELQLVIKHIMSGKSTTYIVGYRNTTAAKFNKRQWVAKLEQELKVENKYIS